MNYTQRITAFSKLGDSMKMLDPESPVLHKAYLHNNWFTIDMQRKALQCWADLLTPEKLDQWMKPYAFETSEKQLTIAIIMAGNIPLVGFHDLLSVLLSGNKALVKPSSDDKILMKWVLDELVKIEPGFEQDIILAEDYSLKGFDAVIATGSNNSNRYFEYYFKNKPNLLRKNRNSVACLTGNETEEELDLLADDIFQYFGMGCRNVSKLLLPGGYNLEPLFQAFEKYKDIIHHNKYANNYTYHKALFLMNQEPHLDNGFILLKQDDGLSSPLSVLMFQFYHSHSDITAFLDKQAENIQCVVGKEQSWIPFGKSQSPDLSDYADGIDTLNFLRNLTH